MKYDVLDTFSDEDKIEIIKSHFTKAAIMEVLIENDEFSDEDCKKSLVTLIQENLEFLWERAVC